MGNTPISYLEAVRNGVEIELPSTMQVRVRPVDVGYLITQAERLENNSLMKVVQAHLSGKDPEADDGKESAIEGFELWKHLRMFGEFVARECLVHPRIVDNPTTFDEIAISEFSTDDLAALTRLINLPLAELRSFRFEQGEALESISTVEGDADTAKPDAQS